MRSSLRSAHRYVTKSMSHFTSPRYSSKAPFTGGDEENEDAQRRKGKPRGAKEAMKSVDGAIDRGEPGPNAPPVQVRAP